MTHVAAISFLRYKEEGQPVPPAAHQLPSQLSGSVGCRVAVPGETLKMRFLEASQQPGFKTSDRLQYLTVPDLCLQQVSPKEHEPPRAETDPQAIAGMCRWCTALQCTAEPCHLFTPLSQGLLSQSAKIRWPWCPVAPET